VSALPTPNPLELTRTAGAISRPTLSTIDTQIPDPEPEIRFPEAVAQSDAGRMNTIKIDAAVASNRRATPQAAIDQRKAPRYSVQQINSLDPEQIRARLAQLDTADRRPGWVKFLDLIDMPRNAMANAATGLVLPEARRMAIERGDFDQSGAPKVYGADMLRAMGLENRAVNAVGGFLIDVVTDPLSWIGGPIGGLKTVGSRGGVTIANRGQKLLRGGIKTLGSTGSLAGITDDATRKVFEATINAGRATGAIDDTADAARLAAYVSDTLLGQQSLASKGVEFAKLGGSTKGGALAEDLFAVTKGGTEKTVEEAARIAAVKQFVAQNTTNPGKRLFGLGAKQGDVQLAHVPFTNITVNAPAFTVPGTRIRLGKNAETQRIIANALSGKVAGAARINEAVLEGEQVRKIADRVQDLYQQKLAGEAVGDDVSGVIDEYTNAMIELGEWQERSQARNIKPLGLDDLESPESVGDLLATMELEAAARSDLQRAAASLRLADIDNEKMRLLTAENLDRARSVRQDIAAEAKRLGLTPEDAFDALANPAKRDQAMQDLIDLHTARQQSELSELIEMSNENLDFAETYVDSLHAVQAAAAEHAMLRGGSVRRALDSKSEILSQAASKMLRINDAEIGRLAMAPFIHMANRMGGTGWDESLANLSMSIGKNLGGVGGTQQSIFQTIRRFLQGGDEAGTELTKALQHGQGVFEGSGGMRELSRITGAQGREYDLLSQWVTMAAESKAQIAAGRTPSMARLKNAKGELTHAGRFRERLQANGWLNNPEAVAKVDEIADEASQVFQKMGHEAVIRGDFMHPAVGYLPSVMRERAASRARAIHKSGGATERAAEKFANAINDPAHARSTNLVEFTGLDGTERSFSLLEYDVFGKLSDEDLAEMYASWARNGQQDAIDRLEETLEAFAEFRKVYEGVDDIEDTMRNTSRMMLPFELNDYMGRGLLDGLIGGPLMNGDMMFETDMAKLLYSRARSDRVAQASDMFSNAISPFILMKIKDADHNALTQSSQKKAILKTGEELELLSDRRYRMGNTVYRHVSDLTNDPSSLFVPELILRNKEDLNGALIPEQLAVAWERMNDTLRPENMGPLMSIADRMTSLFKTTTLGHPSWTIGNIFGNTVLAVLDQPSLLTNPKAAARYARFGKDAQRILRSDAFTGKLAVKGFDPNTTIMVAGRPQRVGDLLEMAREGGVVTGGGLSGDLARQVMRKQGQRVPLGANAAEGGGNVVQRRVRSGMDQYHDRLAELTHLREVPTDEARFLDKARAVKAGLADDAVSKGVSAWFSVNGMVDDWYRLTHFMHLLDEGYDSASAAERTRRAMLNFGDMSSFERNYVRPLVPFYAWTRASLPNFLMRTFRDPKQIAAAPKFVTALEEMFAGEDRLPRWQRPSWMNETLAVQLSTNPESRLAFQIGTLLPQEGAVQALSGGLGLTGLAGFGGEDVMNTLNWAYGQTGPAIKIPTDLAYGRESFTGRSISAVPGEGDVELDDYLFNNIRQIREYGLGLTDGAVGKAIERGGALGGIARSLVGGRFQTGLAEGQRTASLYYELKDREAGLRKSIKRAEREGDDTTQPRLELLALYAEYIQKGVDPSAVPKYVREELAELGILTSPDPSTPAP